jgi:hypothetical protein
MYLCSTARESVSFAVGSATVMIGFVASVVVECVCFEQAKKLIEIIIIEIIF